MGGNGVPLFSRWQTFIGHHVIKVPKREAASVTRQVYCSPEYVRSSFVKVVKKGKMRVVALSITGKVISLLAKCIWSKATCFSFTRGHPEITSLLDLPYTKTRRIKIKVWCVTSEHYYATVFLELLPLGMEYKVDFLAKWFLRSTSWI